MNESAYCISFCNILEVWGLSGWSSDSWDRTLTHWQRYVHRAHAATTETLRDVETTKNSIGFVYKTERERKTPRICKNRVSYPFLQLTTSETSFPHSHSSLLRLFVMLWFSATLAVEALSLCQSLSFLFSVFFSFALSSFPSLWQAVKRLQKTRGKSAHGTTRQKQSAGWTLPRSPVLGYSLSLLSSSWSGPETDICFRTAQNYLS